MATTPAIIGLHQSRGSSRGNEESESPGHKMSLSLKPVTASLSIDSSPRLSAVRKMSMLLKPVTNAPSIDSSALATASRKRARLRQSVTAMINVRRLSRAFGILKNSSSITSAQARPMENTYRTHPEEKQRFSTEAVKRVINGVLVMRLKDVKYNPVKCKELVGDLSLVIRDRVKALGFSRYKIICHVIIGEKKDQGIEVASRSLWSSDTDDWACGDYVNDSLFAVATVHATYFE